MKHIILELMIIFFFFNIGIKGAIGEPGLPGPSGIPGTPGERGSPGGNGKKSYLTKISILLLFSSSS